MVEMSSWTKCSTILAGVKGDLVTKSSDPYVSSGFVQGAKFTCILPGSEHHPIEISSPSLSMNLSFYTIWVLGFRVWGGG